MLQHATWNIQERASVEFIDGNETFETRCEREKETFQPVERQLKEQQSSAALWILKSIDSIRFRSFIYFCCEFFIPLFVSLQRFLYSILCMAASEKKQIHKTLIWNSAAKYDDQKKPGN